MALNTRIRFFLAGIFLTMWAGSFFAQPVIPFRERRVSPVEAEALNVQFSHYALATVETGAVSDLLRSANAFDEIRLEADGKVYRFGLRANDLRDATYTLRVATDTGIVRMPRAANMTYAGLTLRGNYPVRITANEVYFSGMIGQDDGFVFIEPLREYIKGAPANEFIIYHERDARKHFTNDQCGAGHAHQIPATPDQDEDILTEGHDDARRACKVIQIALANDHWMYDEYNSIPGVEAHNMAVINNVSTNYDDEFNDDLQFTVVEIFVSTSVGTDPWPQSTDIYVILDDFTDWGPNGFDNTHDVASLWSGRNFSGDVIGLAWVGAVCTSFRYNVVEDFTSNANFLRVLQAHELGHNFNASHDASGSNTIMAPSVNNSNNWSTQSINQINSFINQINCLGPCQAPQPPVADFDASPREGCAPLVVAFDDMSSNNPTSWNWTFPGGTPGTSTAQNPVVTYSTPGLYNVTLTVSNAQGSNAITQFDFIEVFPDPVADFDYFDNQGVVSFTNLSLHADSYFWEFGDGEVSTVANPVHTYPEDGFYTVTLTVFNECGEDTFTITIEVVTPPTALFDSDITEGCQPLDVQFYNLSSDNAVSFEWSFPGGNPSSSTEFEPFVTYPAPGEYTVTLQAFNSAGEDIFSISDYILVEPEPVADFTFTTAGLTVSFNSSASQAESFDWNFGDGGTSTQPNPTHTYLNSGTYNVTLTVTTDCGTDILQLVVTVLDVPVAGIGSNVQSGCSPLTVQFQSISSGNPTSHAWIFEGGSPGTSNQANPVVTYNTPGTYDVQLTVTNAIGSDVIVLSNYITVLAPTVSDFTYAVNGATAAFTNESAHATSWLWDFGDGDTSAAEDPTHLYGADGTYTVMLVSTGACGSDTSFAQITISTPAQAGFTWQFSGDCVPMTAQFFSTSSANTTAVEWSFPGGSPSTSTAMNPTVTYATPGAYDVTLIAHAPAGSDTLTWSELIDVGSAPDAAFLLATSDLTVTFTNQSVGGSTFFWDFGDGNTSTAENPVHTYPGFGSYTIVMYAENACGADTTEVTIVLGTVPNALFIYSAHNGCAPFQVQFTDQSQNSPTSWLWTFPGGDPATSTAQNPLVTYAIPGSYFVSLRATNVAGTDVLVLDDLIQVAGEPDATFNYTQEGNEIALEYAGTDYDSLRWDFGDGRRDNSLNPTVTYPLDGTYEISLIVFNACGADTASAFVTINVTSTNDPNLNPDRWTLNPNPFGRDLTLSGTPLTDGRLRVEIYDLQGKRISLDEWEYTAGPLSRRLDTDAAAEGMVVIVLNNGTQRIALRAVKTNR